jgi:hypothetical protein
MTTKTILIALMAVYMAVNTYIDIKLLITKNKWHLAFGIGNILFGTMVLNQIMDLFLSLVVSLLIGIIVRKIPRTTLGAGDIKMFMVNGLFLQNIFPFSNPIVLILIMIFLYQIISFLQRLILIAVKAMKKQQDFSFHTYRIKNGIIETPESLPIFIAVFIITQI